MDAAAVSPFPTPGQTSADDRMQRTERRLIEAALAVNEAATLGDALAALATAALTLVDADRISIARWADDFREGRIVAEAGRGSTIGSTINALPAVVELLRVGQPHLIDDEHLDGVDPQAAALLRQFMTRISVPVLLEGMPPITFHASWEFGRHEHEVEAAMSKLRLLARLTGIAFRAERERERAREQARIRAVLESVPEGLVIRTTDAALVNSAARELLGCESDPPVEIGLRTLAGEVVPPSATPLVLAHQTGRTQEYLLRVMRYDGVERIHEGRVAPVKDDDGRVFATVTTFRDVTDEHEQRFLNEQFMARLFDELPLAAGITDPYTGEVARVNQAFVDMVGYETEEIVGAVPPYPWWADDEGQALSVVQGNDTSAARAERLFRRKDGELVPVEMTRAVVLDRAGAPAASVVLAFDLSERRAFEQRLMQSARLASIGELSAGVAHEINNPLFAILGLVEFLLTEAEPGTKAADRLALIQDTALEIKEIVRALLDFARERSDDRSIVSLTDVAQQTVELMRRISSAKHIEIVERYPHEPVHVHASANQLKQIFVNLISNAQQAMKRQQSGTVTVTVGRDGGVAWAEVRDSGPGIPDDRAAKIFEPFFTTRRDEGGTGLGLSVSFGIAQAHGGSLTLAPPSGVGAAFRLRLPADEGGDVRE